ncbi:MAG: efflux RND transporter periplasmic adaptor subunit [Planctomycetota bacterium]
MGKPSPFLVLVSALAAAGALFISGASPARCADSFEAPSANVSVRVVRPIAEMADTFKLPAAVAANRVVRVAAEVAGRIEQVNYKEGERCEPPPKDKEREAVPLIELNTDLLQAEFDRAQAAAKLAADDYDRILKLRAKGVGTEQEKVRAEAAMLTSKAVEKLATVRLARARIFAPIHGVLNDLLVEEGEFVQSGDPVAEIVDIDTVKVVTFVPELDVQFLKVGAAAKVLAGIRGRELEFEGKITYISSLADELTRSTRVEITLDNRRRLLRSGQIVRVVIVRRVLKNAIMIPLGAAIPLEHATAVYVVETAEMRDEKTGKTEKRDVAKRLIVKLDVRLIKGVDQTVLVNGTEQVVREQHILVTNGLKNGDRLIVAGHRFVAPGQPVRIERVSPGDKRGSNPPK